MFLANTSRKFCDQIKKKLLFILVDLDALSKTWIKRILLIKKSPKIIECAQLIFPNNLFRAVVQNFHRCADFLLLPDYFTTAPFFHFCPIFSCCPKAITTSHYHIITFSKCTWWCEWIWTGDLVHVVHMSCPSHH